MRGEGDDMEMEDNGESLQFLPGDDYVEFIYNENANDAHPDEPIQTSPPDKLPKTGRNVGGLIISIGLLLFACGAFILRREYRY